MTQDVVTQMLLESELEVDMYDEVAGLLDELRSLGDVAPLPSPELADLLAAGVTPVRTPGTHRRRPRKAVVAGLAALAVVGGTSAAAAANELPAPAQRLIHVFSTHYLPFEFPDPSSRTPASHAPGAPGIPAGPSSPGVGQAPGGLLPPGPGGRSSTGTPRHRPSHAGTTAATKAAQGTEGVTPPGGTTPPAQPSTSPTPPTGSGSGDETGAPSGSGTGQGPSGTGSGSGSTDPGSQNPNSGPGSSSGSGESNGTANGNGVGNGNSSGAASASGQAAGTGNASGTGNPT
ncbi:MAG: hypothetical protein ACXVW8_01395, partial [Nocardioidaceae bacterium]